MKKPINFIKENTFKIVVVILLTVMIHYQSRILDEVGSVYIRGGTVSIDNYSSLPVEVTNEVKVRSDDRSSALPVRVVNEVGVSGTIDVGNTIDVRYIFNPVQVYQ